MRNRFWAMLGAISLVGLCACGPVNPVIGTGETSVEVTNDLGATITSLEVLAGAPEGFETILPTEDVETIEPGQTVQVNYEVGEAVYDPGTEGSGQTDQTADQPIAEPTGEVGEAPNAVYLDEDGQRTSENAENGVEDSPTVATETEQGASASTADDATATDDAAKDGAAAENGEEALVDEVTGETSDDAATTSKADELDEMPIQGDAIRVVADGETMVFDGLDLPDYRQVSLRTTDDGVHYVDYVDLNGESGNTKEAATQAVEQWEAAKKAAEEAEKQNAADAAAAVEGEAVTEDTTAANGTDPDSGYDEGYTYTDDTDYYDDGTGYDDSGYTDTGSSYDTQSYDTPSYDTSTYDTSGGGSTGGGSTDSGNSGGGGGVQQDEGQCLDDPIFNE